MQNRRKAQFACRFPVAALFLSLMVDSGMCHGSSACTGYNDCPFLPAPPGKTPPCARPGLTYCEHPDNYPGQLIYHLVKKWQVDHRTLLVDESPEDFSAYFETTTTTFHHKPKYGPQPGQNVHHQPEPIYIPKPPHSVNHHEPGRTYIPPKLPLLNYSIDYSYNQYNFQRGQQGHKDPYPPSGQPYHYVNQPLPDFAPPNGLLPRYTGHINDIWRANERLKRTLELRRIRRATSFEVAKNKHLNATITQAHSRRKRQSIGGEALCRVRTEFILPRAAMNKDGDWKFLVNMPQAAEKFTQLVKKEECQSTTCNNLCSIPLGYTARCEQKYAQKRLLSLSGQGNIIDADLFWFPSCCVCTIVRT